MYDAPTSEADRWAPSFMRLKKWKEAARQEETPMVLPNNEIPTMKGFYKKRMVNLVDGEEQWVVYTERLWAIIRRRDKRIIELTEKLAEIELERDEERGHGIGIYD